MSVGWWGQLKIRCRSAGDILRRPDGPKYLDTLNGPDESWKIFVHRCFQHMWDRWWHMGWTIDPCFVRAFSVIRRSRIKMVPAGICTKRAYAKPWGHYLDKKGVRTIRSIQGLIVLFSRFEISINIGLMENCVWAWWGPRWMSSGHSSDWEGNIISLSLSFSLLCGTEEWKAKCRMPMWGTGGPRDPCNSRKACSSYTSVKTLDNDRYSEAIVVCHCWYIYIYMLNVRFLFYQNF